MAAVRPQVIIRMGSHAEKDYLEKTIQFFDGIIFGANLVEATPGATASLMFRFSGKKIRLPYFLDPMTYAFGDYVDDSAKTRTDLDWIKSEQKRKGGKVVRAFKKSYVGLSKALGYPFDEALKRKSAVNASDFGDSKATELSCKAVAGYQYDRLFNEFSRDEELKKLIGDNLPRPAAVFAPYFYIEPNNANSWLDLVLRLASVTAQVERRADVHVVVCVDEAFLAVPAFIERLKKELPTTGAKAVWFWFSRLLEDQVSLDRLKALRSLVESLSERMQVFNMHGGYFSLSLCKYGLAGISHGVGYGEQKDVLPVIGQSTPTVRYYLPDVHKRFGVPQIQRCFNALGIRTPVDFHRKICDCVICKGVVSGSVAQFAAFGDMHYSRAESKRLAQTPAAAKRCRFHFLLSRIRERDWIKTATVQELISDMQRATSKWADQPSMSGDLGYLGRWMRALA